jgi:predicted RNase H-like nuclease
MSRDVTSASLNGTAAHRYRARRRAHRGELRERLLDELKQHNHGRFEADDLYDAFAALWTMRRYSADRSRTIPAAPERDAANLPMQIIV